MTTESTFPRSTRSATAPGRALARRRLRCQRGKEADMAVEEYRVEHDSMGEVRVPAEAKWRTSVTT